MTGSSFACPRAAAFMPFIINTMNTMNPAYKNTPTITAKTLFSAILIYKSVRYTFIAYSVSAARSSSPTSTASRPKELCSQAASKSLPAAIL